MSVSWRDVNDYLDGHAVQWKRCGQVFFDELNALILSAERTIHFQVYIIDPDDTGVPLLNAIMEAAKKGVQVNLVVDDFGANLFTEEWERKLEEAGVNFKKFETFISTGKFYVGRRMHHKVLVIDEKIAMVGGMNIADRYRGTKEVPAWLDYAVVVEGPICKNLALACTRILEKQFNPAKPKWPKIFAKSNTLDTSKVWVRMRKNDWLRNRREITSSYNKAARLATKSITIVGGYFIPGRKYRRLLADASKRGVEIRIILTHYSDVPVVKYASDYLYGWLLKNNIRIFESKELMVHGKVAIVDETWATVGSYNQNHLSAYLSIELNLDIVNTAFAKEFNDHLLHVINTECIEVTHDSYYSKSSWYSKLKRWISYQLVRISLRMLFVVNRIFYVDD